MTKFRRVAVIAAILASVVGFGAATSASTDTAGSNYRQVQSSNF